MGGFVARVLVWFLFIAIAAAIVIPLSRTEPWFLAPGALIMWGIGRAVLGIKDALVINLLAIIPVLGIMLTLAVASPMFTILTAERVPVTAGKVDSHHTCTLTEVDGDRVIENARCATGNSKWQDGTVHEIYLGGVMPYTWKDGSPWPADEVDKNFGWTVPTFFLSLLVTTIIRIVKVRRTYWEPSSPGAPGSAPPVRPVAN